LNTYSDSTYISSADSVLSADSAGLINFIDSVTGSRLEKESQKDKNFFTGKSTKNSDLQSQTLEYRNTDWLTYFILLCLILLAWVNISHRKWPGMIIGSFLSERQFNKFTRESHIRNEKIYIPLFIVYLVAFSGILAFFLKLLPIIAFNFSLENFGIIILILSIGWLIKSGLIKTAGILFRVKEIADFHNLYHALFLFTSGVLILPILIVGYFSKLEIFIYLGVSVWFIMFIYKLLRQIIFFLRAGKFSLFHIFLYLCTLEILPLLVISKAVVRYYKI